VQRIFVHAPVYEDFVSRLVKELQGLKVGDPLDPETDVGPMIDAGALDKVASMVGDAVGQGAEVLVGGERKDPFYLPTVLANVEDHMEVCREEIFGPVTTVSRYEVFDEAVAAVNATAYGLQAGVFTSDIERAFTAHRDIVVGGVIMNDVSAFRADQMPYGGSKDSGYGREGLRYAMAEMTEPRIMVLSNLPL
jgi:acyl-CoA reductase-like NAD-dependent aldehyde dehydrogenase